VTDAHGLEGIGPRLRSHRDANGWSTRELARRSGVSQPFLSQIENGLATPSLTTVVAVAEALGIAPEALLVGVAVADTTVVRAGAGVQLPVTDADLPAVRTELADAPPVSLSEYEVPPHGDLGGFFRSRGGEMIYVLAGRLVVELDRGDHIERTELSRGDSMRYPSEVPHRWSSASDRTTRFLHVLVSW
jgi:transcriptional regulator with XRE-family HTH domain